MTHARAERVEPDPWLAAGFLARAKKFAADGSVETLSPESRQILMHSATVAGCDAVLAVSGRRIEGSDGGHRLRLTETQLLLAGEHDELFEVLDEARAIRNEVSYAAGLAAPTDVEETAAAVRELVGLIEEHVTPHLPDWKAES